MNSMNALDTRMESTLQITNERHARIDSFVADVMDQTADIAGMGRHKFPTGKFALAPMEAGRSGATGHKRPSE